MSKGLAAALNVGRRKGGKCQGLWGRRAGGTWARRDGGFALARRICSWVIEVGGVFQKLCSEKGLELGTMGRAAAALEHPKSGL